MGPNPPEHLDELGHLDANDVNLTSGGKRHCASRVRNIGSVAGRLYAAVKADPK